MKLRRKFIFTSWCATLFIWDLIASAVKDVQGIRLHYNWYNSKPRRRALHQRPIRHFPLAATSHGYGLGDQFTNSNRPRIRKHIRKGRPFNPSPLIHQSSVQHFTQPLANPAFSSEEDEEQFFYSRPIIFDKYRGRPNLNSIQHTRPISIPSSTGADFPNVPKFNEDITFSIDDNIRNINQIANSVTKNFEKPVFQSAKFYRNKRPKFHLEDDEADVHNDYGHEHVQEHFENINPDHFGPSPVDFEPIIPQNYHVEQLSHHEDEPYLHEESPPYVEKPTYQIESSPHPFEPYVHQPHLTDDGCTDDDGSFYAGGQTWSLPDCGRGVCAKSLKGGWQVTHERCDSILQNPQYTCVFDEEHRSEFPECCPKPVQCNKK